MANQIRFGVGFDVNASELTSLKQSLQEIQKLTATAFIQANAGKTSSNVINELTTIKSTAEKVETALVKAFNPKLNTINITSFNNELKKADLSIEKIYQDFSKAGNAGQIGFQRLATSVLTANTELQQTKTILDKMSTTLSNTIKWNLASGAVNKLAGSVQEAYGYVKALDGSLNDIMIVTGKSADEMDRFADKANKAAKSLGVATTDYTNASLTFYQQGLSDEEVAARTDLTTKVANASGLSADDAAEYVTAVLNGYKVGSEEAEKAMDILANVGAHTASSLSELSEAMSKVSSTASTMGVSEEQLAASLATVIQTTRQDASTVGTAFKTIYMRISDIKAGTEDAEVSLGTYTEQMAEMGVNVLDETGNLRDLGEVMEEIGNGWSNMSREQQIALARTMAGTRQANNLLALFDNWEDYGDALGYATNATGTLQKQQDVYMQSTEAHLNKLKTAEEDLFDSFLDKDTVNGFADAFAGLANFTSNWVDALGGGGETLLALGSIATTVFSSQIGKGINTFVSNLNNAKAQVREFATQLEMADNIKKAMQADENNTVLADSWSKKVESLVTMKQTLLSYGSLVTEEQHQEANGLIEQQSQLKEKQFLLEANEQAARKMLDAMEKAGSIDATEAGSFDIESAEVFDDTINSVIEQMEKLQGQSKISKENFDDLANALNLASSDSEDFKVYINLAEESLKEMDGALTASKTLLGENNQSYITLTQAISNLRKAMAEPTIDPKKIEDALKQVQNAYGKVQTDIVASTGQTMDAINAKSEGTAERVEEDIQSVNTQWERLMASVKSADAMKGLTKLIGGIGQITSSLMTLSNIKDTLENDDLSTGEKALRIVQQLSTGLPMLVTGIMSVTSGFSSFVSGLPAFVAGIIGADAATMTLNTALIELWTLLWPVLAVMAAVAAAVGLVALAVNAATKAYNADADAAKEAADQVELLTDRYDELTTSVKNFKNAVSDYDDAVKALDDLTDNTDEYREAVEEANKKAKELIETYKLFGKYNIDENGLIKINQDDLDAAMAKMQAQANEAEQQMYGANIISTQASLKSRTTNTGRKIGATVEETDLDGNSYLRNFTNNELQAAATALKSLGDAALQDDEALQNALSTMDDLSPAIKDHLDVVVKNKNSLLDLADSMQDTQEANEYYAKQIMGIAVKDTYGDRIESIATTTDEQGNAVTNGALVASITAAATEAATKAQADSDASMAQEIAAIDVSKASSNNATNDILKVAGWDEQIQNDESLARLYAQKVLGYDNVDDFTYNGGWNKGTLRDEKGEKVIDEVSDDVMRHALARQAQIDQITKKYTNGLEDSAGGFMDSIETMVQGVNDFGDQFGADFTNSILNAISNDSTKLDLSSLFKDLDPEEVAQLSNMTPEELMTAMGLSEEDLKNLGWDSAQAFHDAFEEGLGKYDPVNYWTAQEQAAINAANSFASAVSSLQEKDDLSGLDENQQAEFEKYLKNTESIQGMTSAYEDWIAVSQRGTLDQIEYLQDLEATQRQNAAAAREATAEEVRNLEAKSDAANRAAAEAKTAYESAMEQGLSMSTITKLEQEYKDATVEAERLNKETQDLKDTIGGEEWELNIDMSDVDDILTFGDNIVSEAEKIKQAAELIGEGFTVAAEDADDLAKIFPEIYENAKVTEEGIVQLDKATVQALLGNQGVLLDGDVDTAVAKIDNEIAVLEAKKEAAEAQLKLWQSVAQGELDISDEALTAMAGGQEDFTNYLIQCHVDANTAQEAVAKAMAGNYDELARIAGDDAYQIDSALTTGIQDAANNVQSNSANMITSLFAVMRQAQEVGKAIAASSNGQVAGNGVGGAGGGATGGTSYNGSVNSNNFKVSDAYKATATGQFASDKISAAELDISSYTSAIAQMQALKARLLANQKDTQAALDGASNGTGGKTDKDKSGSDKNKDKDAKHIDELEEEFDAYHDIDIEIKNITADLERLQKQQSKLSGEALIKNLNKQLELLKKQRDAYAEKIQLATMEANSYKEMLKSYGATFTDDGQISNYYSLLQKELNAVNQAIADYNALSAEDQEAAEADVEAAKKRYETLKNLISNYDTLINDTIPGLENQIEDALYKEIEIHITEFDMEVNLKLDLVDAEKQWNEFKRKIIDGFDDDSVTGAAKEALDNISDYYTSDLLPSQTEKVYKLIGDKTIGGQSAGYIAQIDKISGYESGNLTNKQKTEVAGIADENPYVSYDAETGRFVVDREAALAALKETASGLREELLYLQEQEKAVNEAFLKSIDNIQIAYDKKGEILEFFNDQIQHDMKMMKLLYGDEAYAKMDTYYQKQVESDIQQVNSLQEQAAYWKRLMDAARDAGDSDAYDKYRDNWMKSIKDLNSSIETWAEDITKQYANAVKKIMQELNNQLTDNLGLDYANEELTLLNQNAENYLDTVNSAYAVQSLQNKWQTAIDNTDSISGQRKLNALMEEQMEMLEKKGQLSEYDIQRAEKEYELALRQIALEEAQQNKSKMRLKKDANGNYTYQFVSDEDSIAAAKQELADAQNELYNFDKSAYTNNLNEIYSTWSEFQQKVADAYVTYANDQDKLTEHIALLQEQYGEKINALTEQNCTIRNNLQDSAFTSLAGMYNTDVANFQTMTNDEKDIIMNQLIPQWDSGVQTMADKFGGDDEKSFKSICESTFNKLTALATQYQGVLTSIGTTSDAVSQQVSSEQTTLETEANRALQATKEEYEAVGLLKQEVENLTAAYKASYAEAVAATTAAYAFMKAQKEVDAYQASQNNSDTSSSPSSSSDTSSSSSGTPSSKSNTPSAGSGNGATASSDIIKGIAAAIWCESNSGWGNDPGRKQKLIAKFNQSTRDSVQSYINNHSANGDLYNYWVNTLHRNASAYHYDKFKRGGLADYTGPAWLDGTPTNPELVLNANDTANMLSAVSVLRGIMDTLNGSTLDAIAARLSGLGNFGATVGGSSDSLEQTVYITATFEGQTEANQIQTALDNLVNIASQRAYRNKK